MVQIHAARDVSSVEKRPEMRWFSILCGDATTVQQWTVIVCLFSTNHFDIRIRWWLLYICSLRQRRRSNWARTSSEGMHIKLQRRFLPSPTPHHKRAHGARWIRIVPFFFASRSSNWNIIKRSSLGNVWDSCEITVAVATTTIARQSGTQIRRTLAYRQTNHCNGR